MPFRNEAEIFSIRTLNHPLETPIAGSYNVRVVVIGKMRSFQRCRMSSELVKQTAP